MRILTAIVIGAVVGTLALLSASRVGAYNDDGHFYTAVALAHHQEPRISGTDRDSAVLLGFCAQVPDLAQELDAVTLRYNLILSLAGARWGAFSTCSDGPVRHMVTVHHYLHGLTGGAAQPLTTAALETIRRLRQAPTQDPNTICATGFAVHLLGDSFAHRRLASPDQMYPPGLGHYKDNHDPDFIAYAYPDHKQDRTALWMEYTRTLSAALGLTVAQKDRDALDQIAKRNLAGGMLSNRYNTDTIRSGLRATLGRPVDETDVWAAYDPPIEAWQLGNVHLKTPFSFVAQTFAPPAWKQLKYETVWTTYLQAATPSFARWSVRPTCDVERIN